MGQHGISSERVQVLKTNLARFGKVDQCEPVGLEFHIFITEGYDISMSRTHQMLEFLSSALPEYPTVKKFKSNINLCYLILKS